MTLKKLNAVLVGAGNRGCTYADYALECPNELAIIAVVEPNELRRKQACERYNVPEKNAFSSLETFLQENLTCDFVINATMDELHYETAREIMLAGYNMLLEKPIVADEAQLLELQKIALEKQVKVNICHVLRYTPFFKTIKTLIDKGVIGKIMTMELNEHVWIAHFLDSYVRGKWNRKEKCGSGFLLAKSCHDTDLMCWLNNTTRPKKVFSFGSRSQFIPANAPEEATEFCYNCPHNEKCLYSAQKVHLEFDSMPFQTWSELNKPLSKITLQEKEDYLKYSDYGRCAYNSGGDINDRQCVSVEFENGSIASFTMLGGSSKAGRSIHICGTEGEIEGFVEDGFFLLRTMDRSEGVFQYIEKKIDVSKDVHISAEYGGHAGGDYAIMYELVRYFNGDNSSVSITNINDSINGHRVVYAAEKSVELGQCVSLND